MRIVSVDRFHAPLGGKEHYQLELAAMLAAHGHVVAPFALAEPENTPSPYEGYFPPPLPVKSPSFIRRAAAALERAYNRSSSASLTRLVADFRPDLAHIHTLHHVSISAARALRLRGIPTVATLHDYLWICPVATLFRADAPCEECRPHRYHRAIVNRCSQGSLGNSAAAALDAWVTWMSHELGRIRMIAPSRFVREKFLAAGFSPERVAHIPHFAPVDTWSATPVPAAGPILFVGRLQRLKGAHVLIEAFERLRLPATQQLVIVGDGPELEDLEHRARRLPDGQVVFTGFLDREAVRDWYARCLCAVVPSIWYEVFGLSALEAAAAGRPVIASRIGGLAETVEDSVSGWLVEPASPDALADAIDAMLSDPAQAARMGANARARAERSFAPDVHYNSMLEFYAEAMRDR
jgi:glycosyltransferase involved in cell wall biosynthesis